MPNTWSDLAARLGPGSCETGIVEQLHGLAEIAARLMKLPLALISLDTAIGQVVIVHVGAEFGPINAGDALFAAVLASEDGLIVPDARKDPRFSGHPLVAGVPFVRFFAGIPVADGTGMAIGTLCVMDTASHTVMPSRQLGELQTLAKAVVAGLERWRQTQVQIGVQTMPRQETHGMSRRFETLADALPQLVWSTRSDGWSDYFSQQWCQFTGAPASASFGAHWLDFVHPDDVPITNDAWQRAVDSGEPYTTEFRLRAADGTYRWMLARGLPVCDDFGRITRWIGTCTDIDERVRSGDMMEFLSHELSHRIKNLFAVVQGLIAMALRKHPGMAQVNQALQARMIALGRAHDLMRPRVADGTIYRSQTTLRQLIEILTQPYVQDDPARLTIIGEDALVDERAATPLALFFHEMAINSARFGALSTPQGHLRITLSAGEMIVVEWLETGGPVIDAAPVAGFGLGLIHLSIERQLGGTLTLAWNPEGLSARATISPDQLTAG